jgi:phosphoribosylformylglycinamidine (FGAM) synthase PurS component
MNEITNITTDPRLLILKVNSLLDSLNDQQTATLYTLLNQPNSDEQLRIVVNLICHTILANTLIKQQQGA